VQNPESLREDYFDLIDEFTNEEEIAVRNAYGRTTKKEKKRNKSDTVKAKDETLAGGEDDKEYNPENDWETPAKWPVPGKTRSLRPERQCRRKAGQTPKARGLRR